MRRFFRTAEVIAPSLGGRLARHLWFSVPAGPSRVPLPDGGRKVSVTVGGQTVRGHVWGEGPVIYFVHGWAGNCTQFAAYVGPLTAAGYRVVLFDGLGHGESDPGLQGRRRTNGIELGHALDAMAAEFGPAHAVVAHSMGTIATYLALRFGWTGTARLVLLAPMVEAASLFAAFQEALGIGPRTKAAFDRLTKDWVRIPVDEFDARIQASYADPLPTLVLHDRKDRQTPYTDAVALVDALPDAELVSTDGLGHNRIISDPGVLREVVMFLTDTRVDEYSVA
ncbi:alpha/beta fold hydrolase [Nocardioides speluncae]|uniref:alpha/beta fold hydrolase n=1 Tax=Nocardioides speluncae TaxID=2670337 RepID=UPI00137B1EC5|nr:alpha/beta fold hydrolase [Nocardioides speluncae]